MTTLNAALVFLSVMLLGLFAIRLVALATMRQHLVAYELRFPRDVEAAAVTSFVSTLSGLLPPWWRRWLQRPFVVLEVVATSTGIKHLLLVPKPWASAVENILQATLPALRYERLDDRPISARWRAAAEYRLSTHERALRVDASACAIKLLSNLQPLSDGEVIRLQWILSAADPVQPARVASKDEHRSLLLPANVVEHSEAATALRQKHASALLLGVARITVAAPSAHRAQHLLRHVEVGWHETRAPGVHLKRRLIPGRLVVRRTDDLSIPLAWPGTYNAEELTGLIAWPIGVAQLPGLVLSGYRQVPASSLIPTTGSVIGDSTFPGTVRPLAMDLDARLRHLHVLGPTGTGKSTLLVNMCAADMAAGYGIVLLDPKQDLVRDVLARVPAHRRQDVIVLDPADDELPVGLNPLSTARGTAAEVVVENLVGLFKSLYAANWGPRTDDILRAALLTLANSGNATLVEVPALLTNAAYRRRLIADLDDPVGLGAFFAWYDRLSVAEQLNIIGPVLNKLRAFIMRPRIRAIIGQRAPKLQLADVLREGKILLVPLATGLLGDEAAALLGALVVAELWNATTARAGLPASERRPVMAYLDEWQHFVHLPTPMATVLAEGRGLGLGMTLAHQYLSQLPAESKAAALSTVRSRIIFQAPAVDARVLVRELGGVLTADDLQGLGAYEIVAQLYGGGATQLPATGRTRPLPEPCSNPTTLRQQSRQRYGVNKTTVEAELRSRLGSDDAPKAVGRRPRSSGSRP